MKREATSPGVGARSSVEDREERQTDTQRIQRGREKGGRHPEGHKNVSLKICRATRQRKRGEGVHGALGALGVRSVTSRPGQQVELVSFGEDPIMVVATL